MHLYKLDNIVPLTLPWARAAQFALSSLAGADVVDSDPAVARPAAGCAVTTWRQRLDELHQLRLPNFEKSSHVFFAKNCPPCGFVVRDRLQACRRQPLCPFCWCREYCVPAYRRLLELHTLRPQAELYEYLSTHTFEAGETPAATLTAIFTWIRTRKAKFLQDKLPKAHGAFIVCGVQPGSAGTWLLQHNILALAPPGLPLPRQKYSAVTGIKTARRFYRRSLEENPEDQLSASCGRAALYPARLLTGAVDACVAYLENRRQPAGRRARLCEFYGQLRGLGADERALDPADPEAAATLGGTLE